MNTKTAKQEALELLQWEELTGGQADKVSILTAQQVGYSVRKTRTIPNPAGDIDAYGLFLNDKHIAGDDAFEGNLWAETPDYANSVDACLMLPIPQGYRWTFVTAVEGSEYVVNYAYLGGMFSPAITSMRRGNTLPIAMLLFWWSIQPG